MLVQAVGRAGRSGSALSEADSQAAEAAAGPPLVVFSGGTAFNSVAGARRRPPLPGPPGERDPRACCGLAASPRSRHTRLQCHAPFRANTPARR
jgi:hypothetical protein